MTNENGNLNEDGSKPVIGGTPLSWTGALDLQSRVTVEKVDVSRWMPDTFVFLKKLTYEERKNAMGLQGNFKVDKRGEMSMSASNLDSLADARLVYYSWVTDETGKERFAKQVQSSSDVKGRSVHAMIDFIANFESDFVTYLANEARRISGIETETFNAEEEAKNS